jgi:signal recognition particle subunit SRP19
MEGNLKSDTSRWVVIYPIYINSKKTLAEGRRISALKACENPNVVEIGDCCQYLRLPCAIEVCIILSFFLRLCIVGAIVFIMWAAILRSKSTVFRHYISALSSKFGLLGDLQLDKAYSRDFMQRGRVRVQLKRDDGSLVNPAIPTRKSI